MIERFQPALAPIAPAFRPWVLALVQGLLPLLLRLRIFPWLPAAITAIEVEGDATLAHCWHRFDTGQVRLLLAFRHVEVEDPLLGLHLLSRVLPRRAARLGLNLGAPVHAHFLFDRGMPLWAGRPLGWLLASLGGVSLRRGRQPDWRALRQARQLVLAGRFPFAVAPEGATNGHSECIGPLEPGVAQLALWCVDDLRQAGRSEEVLLLPITIQYTYRKADWPRLARLMTKLEAWIGLSAPAQQRPLNPAADELVGDQTGDAVDGPYGRLVRISEALLDRLECLDGPCSEMALTRSGLDRFGSWSPSGLPLRPAQPGAKSGRLSWRLEQLVERCLVLAESHFGCPSTGTSAQRCRRVEEQSWRWIYRDDLPPRHQLSPLDRALADRAAHGAALAALPMRLAETFVAVSGSYVAERPSFERFMETTLLIHDALARIHTDGLPARPRLGARRARITIGSPISVTECSRGRGQGERRQLLASLSADLRHAFEQALI